MPYIGSSIATNFASTIRDNFTGDGSTTSFTLSRNAVSENDLEVFVGNVRQQPGSAYTVSTNTLAFTGTPANGEVIYVVHQAGALQTVRAGTDFGARDLQFSGDSQKITFGIDSDVTLTHVPDSGLAIKSIATADDKPVTLVLQTGETDIAADDKLGVINFQAPDEGTGTDAILVAAGIEAVSEGDFSSSSNATKLSFLTGSSGTATEKMSISSGGNVAVSGNMTVAGDLDVTGTVSFSENNVTDVVILSLDTLRGDADTNTSIVFSGSDVITVATGGTTAATFNASQILTLADDLIIKSGGTIGGANDTDLLTLGNGILTVAGEVSVTTLDIGGTNVTSTAAELNLLDGVSGLVQADLTKLAAIDATAAELNLLDGGTSSSSITLADADGFFVNDGGTSKLIPASDIKTYIGSSTAADDLTIGDAAILLTTSSGNITIDAAANDSDIIFKGTDGGSDKIFATFDGSAGGDLFLNGGLIDLKNDGSNVSQIKFYCESSNAHAQTLIGAPHAQSADNTLTLPSGADGVLLSTTSTATVTNKTLTSPVLNTATVGTSIVPASADGATLGTASAEFSDLFLADSGQILFGNDQDITLTHSHNTGLILKSTATSDDTPAVLTLATGDTDIAVNDVLGAINFQAPDEGAGTDAILVAARIQAVSEGDFSASNNATKLEFHTAASENASSKMTLSSAGLLTIADDLVIKDGGTIGVASDADAITIASNGVVTFSQAVSGTSADFDGGVTIDNITIDGTEIDLSSGDLTIDVAADIILDADGGQVRFKDGGTEIGVFSNSSSDFIIGSQVQDKDIKFQGDDGGSGITALTLDMSDAGKALFNAGATFANNVTMGDGTQIQISGDGGSSGLQLLGNDSDVSIVGSLGSQALVLRTASTERLRITSAGNVGINSTAPNVPLLINKSVDDHTSTAITIRNSSATGGYGSILNFESAQTNGNILKAATIGTDGAEAWNSTANTSSNLKFSTMRDGTLTEAGRFTKDGNLFVGTTDADLSNNTSGQGHNIYTSGQYAMAHEGNNMFYMNLTNYSSGTQNYFVFLSDSNTKGTIGFNGSSTVYATSSDYRLKENVVTEWDATTRLKQLKPSRFNFIANSDTTVDGFLAHEVSSIIPEAVIGEKDAMTEEVLYVDGDEIPDGKKVGDVKVASKIDPQGIDQSKLVPLLTKALQEQQAVIESLTTRIKTLEDA